MRLLLSSDAAPDASSTDLRTACHRRALTGLELVLGAEHRHGGSEALRPPGEQADVSRLPQDDALVEWFYLPHVAHRLGVGGLILPNPVANPPPSVPFAFVHGTDPVEAEDAVRQARRSGGATCWEVTPRRHEPGLLEAVLDVTFDRLVHMRLMGGGPEAQVSEARRANPLWQALALRGYTGTIALAPSPGADLQVWHRWLFETRGWGCNTAAEKQDRVSVR